MNELFNIFTRISIHEPVKSMTKKKYIYIFFRNQYVFPLTYTKLCGIKSFSVTCENNINFILGPRYAQNRHHEYLPKPL